MIELRVLRADGDRCAVRLERRYGAAPDEPWAASPDRTRVPGWTAGVACPDARAVGEVELGSAMRA